MKTRKIAAFICLLVLAALCGPVWADCDADCLIRFAQCKDACTGDDRAKCTASCFEESETCAALCNPLGAAAPREELPDRPPEERKTEPPAPAKTAEEAYEEALTRAVKTDTCASFCGGRARRCVDGCGEKQAGGCAAGCSNDAQVCQAVCYARQQRERREQRQAGPKKK